MVPVFSIISTWFGLVTISKYFLLLNHRFHPSWARGVAVRRKGRFAWRGGRLQLSRALGLWAMPWAALYGTGLGWKPPGSLPSMVLLPAGWGNRKSSLFNMAEMVQAGWITTGCWHSPGFPIPGSLLHLLLNFSDLRHLGWCFPDACQGSFLFLLKAM